MMQLALDQSYAIVGIIIGIIIVGSLLWNTSRNSTKQALRVEALESKHDADMAKLKEEIRSLDKETIQKLADSRNERKEEISASLMNHVTKFENIQKQIDVVKFDIKDAGTKITALDTKIVFHAENLHTLKADIIENKMYASDEHHRLDDRISKDEDFVRDTLVKFFSDEKTINGKNHTK